MFYHITVCYCIFLYHTCIQCLIISFNTKVGTKEVRFRQYMYQYLFLTSHFGKPWGRTIYFIFFGGGRYFKSIEIFQLLVSQNENKIILCIHFRVCLCYPSIIVYDLKVVAHRGYKKHTIIVGNPGPGLVRYKMWWGLTAYSISCIAGKSKFVKKKIDKTDFLFISVNMILIILKYHTSH